MCLQTIVTPYIWCYSLETLVLYYVPQHNVMVTLTLSIKFSFFLSLFYLYSKFLLQDTFQHSASYSSSFTTFIAYLRRLLFVFLSSTLELLAREAKNN